MKYPILVLVAAIALVAATPNPSPSPASTPLPTPPPLNAPAGAPANSNPGPAATNQAVPPSGAAVNVTPTPNAALDNLMNANGIKTSPAPKGNATPTPPPADNRKGVEGVWEVQIQRGENTQYTHFSLRQTGTALTGTYLDGAGKKFPLAGSLDGQSFRIVVSLPDGSTVLMEGRLDGTTDMLGMLTDAKERVPFTAAYRPKEKWFDNINAAPGGMGGGGYGPPR